MFIGKYTYNQYWETPFLFGLDIDELNRSFRPMAAYLCVAFAAALPFCGRRLFDRLDTGAPHGKDERIATQGEMEPTLAAKASLVLVPAVLLLIGAMQGVNPSQIHWDSANSRRARVCSISCLFFNFFSR